MLGYTVTDAEDAVLDDRWTNNPATWTLPVLPHHISTAVQCICVKASGAAADTLDVGPYGNGNQWDLWRHLKDQQLRKALDQTTRAEPIPLRLQNAGGDERFLVLLTLLRLLVENDIECKHRAYPSFTLLVASPNECNILHLLLRAVGPKRDKKAVPFYDILRFFTLVSGCGKLTADA